MPTAGCGPGAAGCRWWGIQPTSWIGPGLDSDQASPTGSILVVAGVAIKLGVPLGHLPGDIVIQRGRSTFYFPIVTCIVVSLVVSIVAAFLRR